MSITITNFFPEIPFRAKRECVVRGENSCVLLVEDIDIAATREHIVSGNGDGTVVDAGTVGVSSQDDGNNSDNSVKDIHFNDGEEERDLGLENGFDDTVDKPIEQAIVTVDPKPRKKSIPPRRPIGPKKKKLATRRSSTASQGAIMEDEGAFASGVHNYVPVVASVNAREVPSQEGIQVPCGNPTRSNTRNATGSNTGNGTGSNTKRPRKNANTKKHIDKSTQKEGQKKRNYNKGSTSKQVHGISKQVLSGKQRDWNVVTKNIEISTNLPHTYNRTKQLTDLAKSMNTIEGGTQPSQSTNVAIHDAFNTSQNDAARTDGVIPTQTSGTGN
ncbi:hypothetical protein SESBI_11465 [Sesbania bispinosa]|nr:hypothetical protein SESBI_11465 [Sesbania bispinosa]